jgi:hypothetical protein
MVVCVEEKKRPAHRHKYERIEPLSSSSSLNLFQAPY